MRQEIAHDLLGASEAAAAIGLSPFKAPIALWLEKTGQSPSFEGNTATVWGADIEPALRQWYAREFDCAVWVPPASIISAEHPWLRATPDGMVLVDVEDLGPDPASWSRGLELKNAGWRQAHRWGEPGSDEVPVEYLVQCQQGIHVTGVDAWHLVASIGGAPPSVYEVRRDEELIGMIVEGTRAFMRHVADGTPPPIDGTDAWADYVRAKYPWSSDDYVKAGPADELLVTEWKAVSAELARLERAEAELKNRIAAAIGTASGMETSLGKITYRPRRGGPDYKAAFEGLAKDAELSDQERADLLAIHQRRDSRPLVRPRAWSTDR
jgi:putative phage-type endonuclease